MENLEIADLRFGRGIHSFLNFWTVIQIGKVKTISIRMEKKLREGNFGYFEIFCSINRLSKKAETWRNNEAFF